MRAIIAGASSADRPAESWCGRWPRYRASSQRRSRYPLAIAVGSGAGCPSSLKASVVDMVASVVEAISARPPASLAAVFGPRHSLRWRTDRAVAREHCRDALRAACCRIRRRVVLHRLRGGVAGVEEGDQVLRKRHFLGRSLRRLGLRQRRDRFGGGWRERAVEIGRGCPGRPEMPHGPQPPPTNSRSATAAAARTSLTARETPRRFGLRACCGCPPLSGRPLPGSAEPQCLHLMATAKIGSPQ